MYLSTIHRQRLVAELCDLDYSLTYCLATSDKVTAPSTKTGAFAESVVDKSNIQMRVSDGTSFEDVATQGAGIITLGQGLYQLFGLPRDDMATLSTMAFTAVGEAFPHR